MANYYLNDDGSTSTKVRSKGTNYVMQDDGSTITSNPIVRKKKKKKEVSFLDKASNLGIGALKTLGNIATNMGEGALRSGEGIMDTMSSWADKINNPLMEKTEVLSGVSTKKEAKKNRKEREQGTKNFVKRDLTNEFQEATGFNDIRKEWEKDSLVKKENLGGQISQGIGGMVPSMLMGQATGLGEVSNVSTKGLSTGKKILTGLGNFGRQSLSNLGSTSIMGTSSYGQALQEAYQNGATDDEATKYALGSSATEIATEWITGGIPGVKSTGIVDKSASTLINKTTGKVGNDTLKAVTKTLLNAGYEAVGEGLEEGISEIISPILKNATYSKDEKVDWNSVFQSVIVGGVTGGILNAPNTTIELKNNISDGNRQRVPLKSTLPTGLNQNLNTSVKEQIVGNLLIENTNKGTMPLDSVTLNRTNNPDNSKNIVVNSVKDNSQLLQSDSNILSKSPLNSVIKEQQNINSISNIQNVDNRFEYKGDHNRKIDNLRKSANEYLNNSDTSKSFIETAEKVITDKGYNIVLDNALTSQNGNIVNAQIKTLENGETEIRINPNSERAGEFLLTHEITHAIENDEMVNLVMDYASKNKEFNSSLESLKQTYGANDVSSEVLADISGQLFGNEEFINTLSTKKPNIFKRLYDSIISLANKITGNSRESLFIKDLKNKWEKAYREQNNTLTETQYMMTGIKGTKNLSQNMNNKELLGNYKEAILMDKKDISKQEIRNKTGWFKDVNGDWKFEISDKNSKLKLIPKTNHNYKLNDILEHDLLYKMYPTIKNTKILFRNLNTKSTIENNSNYRGLTNKITGTIYLDNKIITDPKQLELTLLHELQHNIQGREKFQNGTTKEAEGNYEKYKNNFGETEARETASRKNMSFDERIRKPSYTSTYDNKSLHKLYTKSKNKWYNILGGNIDEDIQENIEENNTNYSQNNVGSLRELNNNSSFSFDENAKLYNDLQATNSIKFFKKDNGDVKVYLLDSNDNIVNDLSLISRDHSIKALGKSIGEYIYENSDLDSKTINIGNDINNIKTDTDYFMSHRPSEEYGNASNFEETMADIFEHPEWYINMEETYNRESLESLRKVRNKPNAEIKIYRATPGNKINPGDWVTPSRRYAEYHNYSQFDGKGNIIEMTVKARDVLFAGDDINEFGYFPENNKYSKEDGTWKQFVEKNFKSSGTKSYFENMRQKDVVSTEQKLLDKKKIKLRKKYESEKNKVKKYMTKEASKILEFSDYKTKQKFADLISEYYDNPNYGQIKQDIIDNFSEQRIDYINEELKDIKKTIRGTDLKLNDYVRKNMADYTFFKKSNFNKLKLKNEGQSIDSFYTEMSDAYPSVFSKDLTNEVDQLQRLSEFMSEDITYIEKYKLDSKAIEDATKFVYDSLKDKYNIDDLINSISISPKEVRKEKTIQYREEAENFVNNSVDWIDKKSGLAYKTNTMKRNFYDVMGAKDGARLYSNYIQPIFSHNAQMQKDITNYNERISKLNLNEKESQAVQMFGEYKYNPETLVTGMQVDDFLEKNKLDHKKIENAVEVFRKTYDELFERVNSVLKEQGYKEIDYRKGYFPHFVDEKPTGIIGKTMEKIGWKFKNNSIPTSIAGITDTFKPGKVWTSFQQARKGKITDYNALKGMDNYIRGAMETIYFTEDIQKLRALENEIRYQHSDKGIQAKIDELYDDNSLSFEDRQDKIEKIYSTYITPLNNLVTELRDYTNGIANKKSGLDRTVEALANRKYYNVMENVSNRLSANMVGMNFSSAITNFIPITQATSQIKSKYLIKGLKDSIKNQYSADNFESKSVFLTSRLNAADTLYKTRLDKVSEKMNFMFDGIDSITSNTIVRGKYYENKAKGMTDFAAMRNADEFARDLMAGRTKGEMPTAFNSKNPLIKTLTAFQLEVNNQFGYMFKDLPRDLSDEGKNKLVGAFIKMFLGAWIYNQLTEKVVGRKAAFSPIDTIKEVYDKVTDKNIKLSDKSADILENLTQDIPFVGGLIGGGRLPISSVANPLKVLQGESTVKDEAKKALYYTVLPFGGGQLKKTVEGASMYVNDRKTKGSYSSKGQLRFEAEKDPASVAQSLIFGQYAGKNGREYFNNGYSPLTDDQLKEVEDMNISVSKYRQYQDDKKEINKVKSDKDSNGKAISGSAAGKKAYLIMNSNFSKKEKNYLLSKISNLEASVKVSDLERLPNNKKVYKFYYGLSKDSKKDFINEINNYNVDAEDLYNYYSKRKKIRNDYTSKAAQKELINYIKNSNFDEKTKWHLYNKDYGSDTSELLVNTFKIKTDDYFNTMEYADGISNKYQGTKNSKIRKQKVFEYINNLKCSQQQKIVLFSQAGYSTSSYKNSMYKYINNLNLSKSEKETIWKSLY